MSDRPSPVLELTKARCRELLREPGALFWTFGFPVLLTIALGLAFRNQEPSAPRVAVAEGAADWLAGALADAQGIELIPLPGDALAGALRRGEVDLVAAPEEAGADGRRVIYRYDPTRAEARTARLAADDALQRALGRVDAVTVREEAVVEPGSRYVDFLFPGVLGMNLMMSSLWGIGYTIVQARRWRLLKLLSATPMRRSHFLLSHVLSRLFFLVLEVAFLLSFGALAFGVALRGSVFALAAIAVLGAGSFAAMALVIAARLQSVEAANGWLNFIAMPMWLLSGTFFSYARFPEALHPLIRALPLTALNDALRAVVGGGASLVSTWPQLAVMAAWGLAGFALALWRFRWQ